MRAALPRGRCFLPVAESFSGPLAIRSAAERPRGLAGLVLAATFLHRPLHPLLHPIRGLVGARLFGVAMPAALVRHFMAGPDAPDALVREVQAAVGATTAEVMALRAMEALRADVRAELGRVDAPILVLPRRATASSAPTSATVIPALRPDRRRRAARRAAHDPAARAARLPREHGGVARGRATPALPAAPLRGRGVTHGAARWLTP